ncbi:MAG: hypothetical protein AAB250_02050, partial [Bdellovibrionota bacterium]
MVTQCKLQITYFKLHIKYSLFFALLLLRLSPSSADVIDIRVDEFKSDRSVAITELSNGKTVVGILRREIERTISADTGFVLSTTAKLSLNGTIRELTITDRRVNAQGSPLERLVKIRVDFAALDELTGRDASERNNVIEELSYYTDTYSLEQGLTDREAIEEKLLIALARRIVKELNVDYAKLPTTASAKIELSPEEKSELDAIGAVPAEGGETKPPHKWFSWNLGFENEAITVVEGTLTAAGQPKRTTNRFSQNTTLTLEPITWGNSELKGVAISKYRPEDLRELTLQRGELEYSINPNNILKAGTVTGSISKYIFDQTLAGATFERKMELGKTKNTLFLMGGQDFRADGLGDLPRVNYGGFWKTVFGEWGEIQISADATRDKETFLNTSNVLTNVDNRLFGAIGKLKTPFQTEITVDVNRSEHKELRVPDTTFVRGDLLDAKLTQKIKDLTFRAEYYNADQLFRIVYGSATTDREKSMAAVELPGKFLWLDYTVKGDWTRTNKIAARTLVEQLGTAGLSLSSKPFAESSNWFLKNLAFTDDLSLRRTYDDVVVAGTAPGSNRQNY